MAKQNKPAIRFKGFTDAWEQRKAKDLCSISTGKSNTQDRVDDGIYPFYVRSPIVEHSNRYLFDEEAVLTVGDGVGTGKVFHYVNGKYDLHQRVYRMFDFSEEITAKYFYYYFSNHFYDRVMSMTAKTSVDSVRYEMIADMDIALPKVKEQMAISAYFDRLDHLITLHQRKYDKLQVLKKAMLEKMFPKNGSSVPEIRFEGFTDAWEQRKFSDITFPAGEKNKENLPLESYSITNENGFVPQDEKFENGGTMREADKRMYYIVSPNSFAYNPARINVGSIGYQDTGKSVIVSSLYEVFKTSDDVDDRLLWHWFKSPDFQKLIMQLQEGGVRLYFYYDKLCMGQVSLPSLEEQRKIGKLFDTLDHLITLHQRELEKLQNIKKSMLEKMFV
ncbi:restriction endonuclease subunit S [Gemmiger formicilis]|uniref:restriction endonuclease subunit S n=1 Tax=Gemmiger formicilis TaxID=745368 RepID=UPI0022E31DAC|nr:restriction endonuclease subunit S [Gemmiger formicilis]